MSNVEQSPASRGPASPGTHTAIGQPQALKTKEYETIYILRPDVDADTAEKIQGRVAEVVGRKLQELAAGNQVICVTHLPQIASFGTTHFFVWKEDSAGHTRARIRRLDSDEERVNEVARMLGGESVPASAVLHARELLDGARGRTAKARR